MFFDSFKVGVGNSNPIHCLSNVVNIPSGSVRSVYVLKKKSMFLHNLGSVNGKQRKGLRLSNTTLFQTIANMGRSCTGQGPLSPISLLGGWGKEPWDSESKMVNLAHANGHCKFKDYQGKGKEQSTLLSLPKHVEL